MAYLDPIDLAPFAVIETAKAEAMIADAEARAVLAAPCLAEPAELTAAQVAAVKAILREAVLRRNDSGNGAVQQQTAGPFSQTIQQLPGQRSRTLWPSEIEELQNICQGDAATGQAFSIDTAPGPSVVHADICSINFGATYCSCGALLTGLMPLYEWP